MSRSKRTRRRKPGDQRGLGVSSSREQLRIKDVMRPPYVGDMLDARVAQAEAAASLNFGDVVGRLEASVEDVDGLEFLCSICFHTQMRVVGDPGEWGSVSPI